MTAPETSSESAAGAGPHPPSPGLSAVRAVAFDCYGTLINFGESHFIDVMGIVCLRHQFGIEGKALWDRWLAMSREVWRDLGRDPDNPTAGPEPRFGTYVEIWTEQFERAFHELELEGDAKGAYELTVEHCRQAPAFPESREVLERLRPHYRLCVLSNADDNWLHPCLRSAGLEFELTVSSESAQSYKPRRKIFDDTAALLGMRPEEILYVGDSPYADVLGARHAGMPVAWLNRYGAKLPEKMPEPDLEITDLHGLLPALLGRSGAK
jgi:2-haloalkanoic acid dehalogenase type II